MHGLLGVLLIVLREVILDRVWGIINERIDGLLASPAPKWALDVLRWIIQDPFHLSSVFGVLLIVSVFIPAYRHERKALSANGDMRAGAADLGLSIEKRHKLIQNLKGLASADANVKILFANVKHRSLAETLISVFELAGWQTNLNSVPLDSWRHDYIEGTEVLGYNKHFVEGVAEFLAEAGMSDVHPIVNSPKIKPDNAKYSWVQQYIKITVGHQD